jgi:hypothetical protein
MSLRKKLKDLKDRIILHHQLKKAMKGEKKSKVSRVLGTGAGIRRITYR